MALARFKGIRGEEFWYDVPHGVRYVYIPAYEKAVTPLYPQRFFVRIFEKREYALSVDGHSPTYWNEYREEGYPEEKFKDLDLAWSIAAREKRHPDA